MPAFSDLHLTWPFAVGIGVALVAAVLLVLYIRSRRPHPEAETRLSEYE